MIDRLHQETEKLDPQKPVWMGPKGRVHRVSQSVSQSFQTYVFSDLIPLGDREVEKHATTTGRRNIFSPSVTAFPGRGFVAVVFPHLAFGLVGSRSVRTDHSLPVQAEIVGGRSALSGDSV